MELIVTLLGDHIALGSIAVTKSGASLIAQTEYGKGKLIDLYPGESGNRFSDDSFDLSVGRDDHGRSCFGISREALGEYLKRHDNDLLETRPPLVVIPL